MPRYFAPDPKRQELYAYYYAIYRDLYPHINAEIHAAAELGMRASIT